MPVDIGIYGNALRPVRSVADYDAEAQAQQQNALGLQAARQNLLMGQQKAQEYQRGVAEQDQIRRSLQSLGGTATDEQRIQALKATGLLSGFTQADALQKSLLERDKTRTTIGLEAAKTDTERESAIKMRQGNADAKRQQAVQQVASLTTPQEAMQLLQQYQASGDVHPATAQALGGIIQSDPKWQLKLVMGLMDPKAMAELLTPHLQTLNAGGFQVNQAVDKITGKPMETGRTAITQSADNAASNATHIQTAGIAAATARRGQDLTDARQREANDNANKVNGKPPAGYVWGPVGPDGNATMIAVKGGPADMKMVGALNQDTQALTGSIAGFDRLAAAANEVLNHPGLNGITGLRGVLPNVPGGQAANAEALLGTLKSQVGFGVLQDMRNNSKTGGALGSVSDAEGKRLEANLAALDKSQSVEQYRANLKKIIDYSEQAKGRVREAFNLKHGDKAVTPSSQHPPEVNDLLKKYGR